MATDALQEIRASLIAADVEIEFIRSHFGMKDADFAVLKDHLDAIGRMVEEALSSDRAPNMSDCGGAQPSTFLAYPPCSR